MLGRGVCVFFLGGGKGGEVPPLCFTSAGAPPAAITPTQDPHQQQTTTTHSPPLLPIIPITNAITPPPQSNSKYGELLRHSGEAPVAVRRVETVEEVLREADVVSLHCNLDANTHHLINAERLKMMKPDAVLVNAARGPCIDEAALVAHMKAHPNFRAGANFQGLFFLGGVVGRRARGGCLLAAGVTKAYARVARHIHETWQRFTPLPTTSNQQQRPGLDVFEDEPAMKPGLAELPNAVIVPHIASASMWTRSGMATLAAANVAGVLQGFGAWGDPNDVAPFLEGAVASMPRAAPSIVNAKEVGLATAA